MVSGGIRVEFARPSDAPALAAMSRDLIEAGLRWAYRSETVGRLIAECDNVALVTRAEEQPVGFAIMRFGDERAHLVLLAVAPTHQRQGIARRMVEWLVESTRTAGVISIHVELRADNPPAYALYRSIGFAETFRVPGYYQGRETAVRMVRILRAPGAVTETWRPPTLDAL